MKRHTQQEIAQPSALTGFGKKGDADQVRGKKRGAGSATVTISAPNLKTETLHIVGVAPYVQSRFGSRAIMKMRDKMTEGSRAGTRNKREPRDFDADYFDATHWLDKKTCGIPATAFRNAAISACKLTGHPMTKAKLSVFVLPDGFDMHDGSPLVKLIGAREKYEAMARNSDGSTDIRARAMFRKWECYVTVRYDADQFTRTDIANLFMRAGQQVGIGEGRPDSRKSAGLGFGLFDIK